MSWPDSDEPIRADNVCSLGRGGRAEVALEMTRLTDAVEKRFCSSERATLIQDQEQMRNLHSEIPFSGFVRFKFQFHSFFAETFSTASTLTGHEPTQWIT
jgi:hypothetical protein